MRIQAAGGLTIISIKDEVTQVKEEKPKKPAAKSMMEMLREMVESLE